MNLRHIAALLAGVVVFAAGPVAGLAADQMVALTLDGRPIDRAGGIAILHQGVVYADVVDLTKAFDGLLTFEDAGNTAKITVNEVTGSFSVGNRSATIGKNSVHFPAPVFKRNGDIYVPVTAFAQLAGAKTRLDPTKHRMDVIVNTSL